MERTMSVEDKIKRAEEIYAKRQEGIQRKTATVSLNNDDNKKDIKLLKKMVIQIILSLLIYGIIYIIQNNNYIFSEEFLKKADEILSYDMNFSQMYQDIKSNIEKETLNIKNNLQKNDNQQGITNLENNAQNETEQGAIGGANEQETNTTDVNSNQNNTEENNSQENTQELSQEEFLEGVTAPRNKELIRVFKDVDLIENIGSGVLRILDAYDKSCFKFMDHFLRVSFKYKENPFEYDTEQVKPNKITEQDKPNKKEDKINLILEFCKEPKSVKEIMEYIGLKHRPTFMYDYLNPLLEKDKLQMTIPDKPKSRNQKYVTILQKK